MCGVFGLIYAKDSDFDFLKNGDLFSLDFITRRGPDAQGFYRDTYLGNSIFFGHTRLSIIDTSTSANQPMQDPASDWVLVYNGEIYNYIEVRDELINHGWSFHSKSDTEVLLKAWAQWGLDALGRLNGMFAFAVFNKKSGELWLIRDRFGVKPLLLGRLPAGGFVFSSSVAAVANSIKAPVNPDYCAFGLRYKAFEGSEFSSPFVGVNSLPPGGWLKIQLKNVENGGLEITEGRWYDLHQAVSDMKSHIESCSYEDLLSECEGILTDAIRLRLRSDVPLAVSLSGGLDSSTVAALAAEQVTDLHGFTYGSPQALQSEGPVVERFTNQSSITPHYIWPVFDTNGLETLLERTLACQEAPFPGLSVMAQNEVFRVVRESGFKVLLGGQGGDEAFAGYRKFFLVAARHAVGQADPSGAFHLLCSLGLMLLHEARQARLYMQQLGRYRTKSDFSFSVLDWPAPEANLWGGGTGLTERQVEDIQRWSIPTLLRYEDRNSMGHGVETRLPFMDYRLVEFALALPVRMKIAHGFGKWALRQLTHNKVPDFIRLNRQKRGFDVTQSWVSDGLGRILRERISDNRRTLDSFLKPNIKIEQEFSDEALMSNSNLLDEALMLAWLIEPVRQHPVTTESVL